MAHLTPLLAWLLPLWPANAAAAECGPPVLRANDILYIGDSISASPYGAALAQQLTLGGVFVDRYAVASSAAVHWRKGFQYPAFNHTNTICSSRSGYVAGANGRTFPTFSEITARVKPAAVVIALGTNDLHNHCTPGGGSMWLKAVTSLVQDIPAGTKCVWVLPWTYQSGVIARACQERGGMAAAIGELRAAIGTRCQFVESSRDCPVNPRFDNAGVHPIGESATALGSCVGKRAKQLLRR